MKKLLSLLLALIMCFGVLVACDGKDDPSEMVRPSGDEELSFYYRQTKKIELDKAPDESFKLAQTYLEYASFAEDNGFSKEITEEGFADVYVFLATRVKDDNYTFMGYYNLGTDKNGYWINAGQIDECNLEVYNSDGTISHYATERVPFAESTSNSEEYTVMYDIVVVSKTDINFEIDSSKPITVYKTTYHFVSSN